MSNRRLELQYWKWRYRFTIRQRRELREKLLELGRPCAAWTPRSVIRDAHWAQPLLVGDVGYHEKVPLFIQMQHDCRPVATVFPGNGAMRNRIDHAPSAC